MNNNHEQYNSEHISSLRKIKEAWMKKQIALRLDEATKSDPNQLHQISNEIENANKKIAEIDQEIIKLESIQVENSNNNLPEPSYLSNDNTFEDEVKVIEIFKQEVAALDLNSEKKDFSKLINIKSKLNELLFKDLDAKISYISSKKQLIYTSAIFDKIYANSEFDEILRQEVIKIRENKEDYKNYDRSLIVSALSLSLINFKFDKKKANLLIDFITDFEDGVWERALTGLVLALLYQNNSWYRFDDFRKRLEVLKEFDKVQMSIKIIDNILKNKLYKLNIFIPDLFTNTYFQNPMNCFIPYFENNEIFQEVINNASRDFDVINFEKYIYDLPVMEIVKYAISLSILDNEKEEEKKDPKNKNLHLLRIFQLNNIFSPYLNLVGEYYYFFSYFPDKYKNDVFKNEFILTNTKLKDVILNKVLELLLSGNTLYHSKNYLGAIQKFNNLLKIEKNNIEALFQIGNCYWELDKYEETIKYYVSVEKLVDKAGENLLFRISKCYFQINKYDKTLQYCEKIDALNIKPSFNFLILKARCFYELELHEKANSLCQEAENLALDEDDMIYLAEIYHILEKNHRALEFAIKAVEIKNDFARALMVLGSIYSDLFDWDKAINSLKKAHHLDKKDRYSQNSSGFQLYYYCTI